MVPVYGMWPHVVTMHVVTLAACMRSPAATVQDLSGFSDYEPTSEQSLPVVSGSRGLSSYISSNNRSRSFSGRGLPSPSGHGRSSGGPAAAASTSGIPRLSPAGGRSTGSADGAASGGGGGAKSVSTGAERPPFPPVSAPASGGRSGRGTPTSKGLSRQPSAASSASSTPGPSHGASPDIGLLDPTGRTAADTVTSAAAAAVAPRRGGPAGLMDPRPPEPAAQPSAGMVHSGNLSDQSLSEMSMQDSMEDAFDEAFGTPALAGGGPSARTGQGTSSGTLEFGGGISAGVLTSSMRGRSHHGHGSVTREIFGNEIGEHVDDASGPVARSHTPVPATLGVPSAPAGMPPRGAGVPPRPTSLPVGPPGGGVPLSALGGDEGSLMEAVVDAPAFSMRGRKSWRSRASGTLLALPDVDPIEDDTDAASDDVPPVASGIGAQEKPGGSVPPPASCAPILSSRL